MIKIDCTGCARCCNRPKLTPILVPPEESSFKEYSQEITTSAKKMNVLRKKPDGNCIFLDNSSMACTNYGKRPLECRLYPLLLDFSGKKPNFRIDKRYCPHLETLILDKSYVLDLLAETELPQDWINGYNEMHDY